MVSNALFTARIVVDELVRGGVTTFCVAPGSRSTPLALAVAERRDVRSHVITDERSMGFFALGIARASTLPVAVICTSGTAVANLLPAVVESALGGGALVLLTADRPPELRDCASPQTIDQVGLFGSHARWAADVPMLDAGVDAARVLRSVAARAVAVATRRGGGPTHLNVPLREPFLDDSSPAAEPFAVGARDASRPFTACFDDARLSGEDAAALAESLGRARRGVIVCSGPELPASAVALLAKALGWPVLADPLSGLRFGDHDRSQVACAIEPLLRDETLRRDLRPDAVLRFGLTPPARALQRWLDEAWPAEHVVVGDGAWPDPTRSASRIVRSDAREFCRALASACGSPGKDVLAWKDRWLALSAASRVALNLALDRSDILFDGVVLREVAAALPSGATLMVGNSMPVRDAEAFLGGSDRKLHVVASRGASGIDGVLSTALGAATASKGPVALVLGDLSFLHDSAALVFAARERIPLLVVAVNNDGGGIFSYLPLRDALSGAAGGSGNAEAAATGGGATVRVSADEVFERFFGTPHGADLERVASVTGGFFRSVSLKQDLAAAISAALAASATGPAVLEVRTHRESARARQQAIVRDVQAIARAAQAGAAAIVPTSRRTA